MSKHREIDPSAAAKYREFHRKDPQKTGAFHASFAIPARVALLGKSVHVMYRSEKIDPETLKDPGKRGINYIHEHDSWGVETYTVERPRGAQLVDVPDIITDCQWFVRLGLCLGIAWQAGKGIVELEQRGRVYDELYTTPAGNALLVIRDKRRLIYLVWGGGLDVQDVGIVG